ncbi:MAG: tRNA glutamyl-Q(34) synthetase GluQRS [Gammaproteobacteria bacterium]|nr:tRNA glutamyl-Q(34) synthetase GluQRS [Gammaproteobacteria bacterium]
MKDEQTYRGRFAPSPTGPLHLGSLVAAVASYADARSHRGEWLVRIEDVDETRSKDDAERQILQTLQRFGMSWDAEPVRQSARKGYYERALIHLIDNAVAYRCNCSRKAIAAIADPGIDGYIYPGTCRTSPPPADAPAAWRVRVQGTPLSCDDRVFGTITQDLARAVGDFVVRRADGFNAYQLAVVVDDAEQQISDVVRGADLLWSTPRQAWLQTLLDLPRPRYAHVPVIYGADGRKLSKREQADPVNATSPVQALLAAWQHLGQCLPDTLPRDVDAFWRWAVPRWHIERVPKDRRAFDD